MTFRQVLSKLTDAEVEIVYESLERFIDTQLGADDEVQQELNVPKVQDILDRAE